MKWFGRKAAREAARPLLWRGFGTGFAGPSTALGAGDLPRSYEAQVREAYLGNPVAQRAVRLVAEGMAGAAVYAVEGESGPSTAFGDPPPLQKQGRIKAVSLVAASLLETVAAQLLLNGNAFVQVLQDAGGAPAELFALRPERVTIEADAHGWPAAYLYRVGETRTRIAARDGRGMPGWCI